ncbi:MAG: phosphofructokinase [Chloroflexi bacterium]|nr:MAG: phosphofructokinase [Chloroflexota bacterium]
MVLAPAPLLTVTIELRGGGPDVHLHAGGQGFWLARMIRALGVPVTICASFGGETGDVVRMLIEREDVTVCAVPTTSENVAYVHDRRNGAREPLAEMESTPLSRHEVDELYGTTVVEALEADVCILGGPDSERVVPADMYRRLARDLSEAGKLVVADLSGELLDAAVEGGVGVLKVSHEALLEEGRAASHRTEDLVAVMRTLRGAGAQRVLVSRGAWAPALAIGDELVEVVSPRFEAVDERGSGDSMTAALATALARGLGWEAALRMGAAAGALNATRRGLATGTRNEIERLAAHVAVRKLDGVDGQQPGETATPDELAARVHAS